MKNQLFFPKVVLVNLFYYEHNFNLQLDSICSFLNTGFLNKLKWCSKLNTKLNNERVF